MPQLQEYNFNHVYELVDLVDNSVKGSEQFWNYDYARFTNAATQFSKDTLLHLYIATTAVNYHRRDFRKNADLIDENSMEKWYLQFDYYSIKIKKLNSANDTEKVKWVNKNIRKFEGLFNKMADEVFYILFANRSFLLAFNNLTAETINGMKIQKKYLTKRGTIKRKAIPKWVQEAVFHRDKGRCVFCNDDLTGLIGNKAKTNYDHIVPLDLYGSNDPCNIQLTCESCNKKKANRHGSTSNKYIPWWPK